MGGGSQAQCRAGSLGVGSPCVFVGAEEGSVRWTGIYRAQSCWSQAGVPHSVLASGCPAPDLGWLPISLLAHFATFPVGLSLSLGVMEWLRGQRGDLAAERGAGERDCSLEVSGLFALPGRAGEVLEPLWPFKIKCLFSLVGEEGAEGRSREEAEGLETWRN